MSVNKIELIGIGKKFGRRRIFGNIDFSFSASAPQGIAGHNGAGKSTLVKIIANVLSSSEGKINYILDGKKFPKEKIYEQIGFVAPYLVFYSEFSPVENLKHLANIRGVKFELTRAEELLEIFGLYKRRNDLLNGFSSGMLQRMKFVFALYHNPAILLLDEPTSNLDENGKQTVYKVIEELTNKKLIIIASNETNDLALCEKVLDLEKYKRKK